MMVDKGQLIMRRLLPFWGRVSVIESPVDEDQRDSGLIVPIKSETEEYKRGVVVDIDMVFDNDKVQEAITERIATGSVVYFKEGIKIGDLWIVDWANILAYEAQV